MLNISIHQSFVSGKEQEPQPVNLQTETGIIEISGVTFKLGTHDETGANLDIHLADANVDAWVKISSALGYATSTRVLALAQKASQPEGLGEDFTQEITLTGYGLPSNSIIPFGIMKKTPSGGWEEIYHLDLSFTPGH